MAKVVWLYPVLVGLIYVFITCAAPGTLANHCYSCSDIAHPDDCDKVQTCGSHQQCYTRRLVGPALNEYYVSGCMEKTTCQAAQFSLFGSLFNSASPVGKRQLLSKRDNQPIVTCFQCCQGDYCNQALCGAPKTAKRRCFHCNDVLTPHDCNSITECSEDEQCLVNYFQRPPHHEYRYNLGCVPNVQCGPIEELQNKNMCVRCCNNSDYCNWQACDGWTAPPPTSSRTTEAVGTFTTTPEPHFLKLTIKGRNHVMYSYGIYLDCQAGDPSVTLSWNYRSRSGLPQGVTDAGNGTLIILSLNETNAGTYTCEGRTTGGQTVDTNVNISIDNTPPVVVLIEKEPKGRAISNYRVKLTCIALGYPLPTLTWQYFSATGKHSVPFDVHLSGNNDTLTIERYTQDIHGGKWQCTAANVMGHSQKHVYLP